MTSTVTIPTVGRIMHYYYLQDDSYAGPLAYVVASVNPSGDFVSGCAFDSDGTPVPEPAIQVVQPGELPEVLRNNSLDCFVTWMPYQITKHAEENSKPSEIPHIPV